MHVKVLKLKSFTGHVALFKKEKIQKVERRIIRNVVIDYYYFLSHIGNK
jgi:hypothetical protein